MGQSTCCQCDQIGDFWKFLVTKFLTKLAQIISNFFGYFEKYNSYFKIYVTTYWETFRLLLTQTSGHTARCLTSSLSSAWVFRSCRYMLFGVLISSFSAIFLSLCFLFYFYCIDISILLSFYTYFLCAYICTSFFVLLLLYTKLFVFVNSIFVVILLHSVLIMLTTIF